MHENQNLFSGKNKKKYFNLSSAEYTVISLCDRASGRNGMSSAKYVA